MLHEQLEQHRQHLARATDGQALRKRLLWCGDTLAPLVFDRGTSPDVWRGLGLTVVRRRLERVRGILQPVGSSFVIMVDDREHPRLQRFTVAHELGHLLMADVDRRSAGISARDEEALCESFASRLLIPRADLERQLAGFDGRPSELLRLCHRYDVGLAACLSAAGESGFAGKWMAFVASRRGHPKRRDEVRYRAHKSFCPPFLIPEDTSVASLGMAQLDRRLVAGDRDVGVTEEKIAIRLWAPGAVRRSGQADGPASVRAQRLANGLVVVCARTDELSERWSRPRAAAAA